MTLLADIHKDSPFFDVVTAANISINHITIDDYNLLVDAHEDHLDIFPIIPEYTGSGFTIWIEHEYDADELEEHGFSQDFIKLYRYAQQSPKRLTHLWLDEHGEIYEELRRFRH